MGRRRNNDDDGGRAVEPREARARGKDPDAVEAHRAGEGSQRPRAEGLGPDVPASATAARTPAADARPVRDAGPDEQPAPARRDSIRWGPVWAGLITALTAFLLLQLLAIGVGLVDVGPGSDGGGGWVPGLIGLVAFFIGGLVAGITSAIRGTDSGLLNGFMVWALGTVLILLLSAVGLGQLFGALGNVAGQVGPGTLSNAANSAQGAAPNVSPQEAEQAVRNGALGAFFGLLLSALAAALGGYLGGNNRAPIGRPTDARRD